MHLSIKVSALAAVLLAAVLVTAPFAGSETGSAYDLAATEACLRSLPLAVSGLPPASPPLPTRFFVYRYPRDHTFFIHTLGQLGVWRGRTPSGSYDGVNIAFFASAQIARREEKGATATFLTLVGNVGFNWEQRPRPADRWEQTVLSCLRLAGVKSPPPTTAPRATLATLAGYWGGHTRGLSVRPNGSAREFADDGCCIRYYDIRFRIIRVTGTLTVATAAYRVASFRKQPRGIRIRTGERGTLRLKNGIITSSLTQDAFCSEPAWEATFLCGA